MVATLTVNGITLEVIGTPSWSAGGVDSRGMPAVPHIAATVRIPAAVATQDLNSGDATVLLDLGRDGSIAGRGLWQVGGLPVMGDLVTLHFDGVAGSVEGPAS